MINDCQLHLTPPPKKKRKEEKSRNCTDMDCIAAAVTIHTKYTKQILVKSRTPQLPLPVKLVYNLAVTAKTQDIMFEEWQTKQVNILYDTAIVQQANAVTAVHMNQARYENKHICVKKSTTTTTKILAKYNADEKETVGCLPAKSMDCHEGSLGLWHLWCQYSHLKKWKSV